MFSIPPTLPLSELLIHLPDQMGPSLIWSSHTWLVYSKTWPILFLLCLKVSLLFSQQVQTPLPSI